MTSMLLPGRPDSSRRSRLQRIARTHPLTLIVIGVVMYATGPVFVQASAVSGPVFSFWRLWIGAPALALAAFIGLRAGGQRLTRRALWWILLGGTSFGIHQVLFFSAVKATSVTDVSLMNTLAPILIAAVAVPLFGERPGPAFRLWTLVAMAGAAVVILGASTGVDGSPAGMAMAAANVALFTVFFVVSKLGRDDVDVLPFLAGVMLTAAVTVTGYVLVAGEAPSTASGRDLALAAFVGLVPGAIGHFVMTWPLRWVAANTPPVMRLGQPAIAGALAYVALGEPVTLAHLAGGVLTVAGVAGALLSRSGRELAADARAAEKPPAPPVTRGGVSARVRPSHDHSTAHRRNRQRRR